MNTSPPTDRNSMIRAALEEACGSCACTVRQRDSGHVIECRVPHWRALLDEQPHEPGVPAYHPLPDATWVVCNCGYQHPPEFSSISGSIPVGPPVEPRCAECGEVALYPHTCPFDPLENFAQWCLDASLTADGMVQHIIDNARGALEQAAEIKGRSLTKACCLCEGHSSELSTSEWKPHPQCPQHGAGA